MLGVVALLGLLAIVSGKPPFAPAEAFLYDKVLVPLIATDTVGDRIVIIEVDDRSLTEVGERWPLSRATWATFFNRVAAAGPAAVAADIVFAEPSAEGLAELATEVRARFASSRFAGSEAGRVLIDVVDDVAAAFDADRTLASALAALGDVTLGLVFADTPSFSSKPDTLLPVRSSAGPLALSARTVTASTPTLFIAARGHGAMNILSDPDAVVRRYPFVVGLQGDAYPSLALATRLSDLGASESEPILRRVFEADGGAPLLRFRAGDDRFVRLSFSDVLFAGSEPGPIDTLLRGRYVFVGATAAGIEDVLRTPVAFGRAGVEVHATALENLLLGSWLVRGGAAPWASLILSLVVLGALAALIGRGLLARWLVLAAALGLFVYLALAVALADHAGLALALVPVPFGLAGLAATEGAHRWRWARRERERLLDRERLLEAERVALDRMRAVVEHVADAIVSVDSQRRIRWMNPAAESLFRRRSRTAVDRPVSELVPDFAERQISGAIIAGQAHIGGEQIPLEATATAMDVGGEHFTNYVIRDVAARKALERQKDEFIASVNHELRTPITSMLGSLRLVTQNAVGPIPDTARDLLVIAEKNGERLLHLVNDLLDAAKIDAGRLTLDLRPVPLATLLREAVERHRGFGLRYGVDVAIVTDEPLDEVVIPAEKERLIQVLGNLISNAVKHSPTGARVEVSGLVSGPSSARINVRDYGPGIPTEYHAQLFERFTMAVAGDGQKRPGTGLGLAIAKGIVQAHRGAIGFDTEVGKGTTFWVEMPRLS